MVVEVEEFSRTLKGSLASAVEMAQSGLQAKVALTLRLTVPDQGELQPEMDRITGLILSGVLRLA